LNSFILDANALVKRYAPEAGTPLLNHLFTRVTPNRFAVLNVGVAEVASVIVRKRNDGRIAAPAAVQALASLESEIIYAPAFSMVEVANAVIPMALPLIAAHSINSTDALVLLSALELAKKVRPAGDDVVLVTSDSRLLKAARAEGLTTFDP
jgi:predicted nucleic acid-binding protein